MKSYREKDTVERIRKSTRPNRVYVGCAKSNGIECDGEVWHNCTTKLTTGSRNVRSGPLPKARLHPSDSQKHIWPDPPDSSMQTWSTINKLICNRDVHVRHIFRVATNLWESKIIWIQNNNEITQFTFIMSSYHFDTTAVAQFEHILSCIEWIIAITVLEGFALVAHNFRFYNLESMLAINYNYQQS